MTQKTRHFFVLWSNSNDFGIRQPFIAVTMSDRRDAWYARVADLPLVPELWRLIVAHITKPADMLAIGRTSAGLYHYFGDFVKMAALVTARAPVLPAHYDQCSAKLVDATTLFHPLRWALLTDNWETTSSFEQCVMRDFLPHVPLASHMRAIVTPENASHVQVTGGYSNALLLRALRACGVAGIARALRDDMAGGVDLAFVRNGDTKTVARVARQVAARLTGEQHDPFKWPPTTFWTPASLSMGDARGPLPVQCIVTYIRAVTWADFTCNQIALTGAWFSDAGGSVILTALAAASLFTGHLVDTRITPLFSNGKRHVVKEPLFNHWPFKYSDAYWHKIAATSIPSINRGDVAVRAARVWKYVQRGFVWRPFEHNTARYDAVMARTPFLKHTEIMDTKWLHWEYIKWDAIGAST